MSVVRDEGRAVRVNMTVFVCVAFGCPMSTSFPTC